MIILRRGATALAGVLAVLALLYLWNIHYAVPQGRGWSAEDTRLIQASQYFWTTLPENYPPGPIRPLPTNAPVKYPRIQFSFPEETPSARMAREERQLAVKQTFARCWDAYRQHAWLADELAPVSGNRRDTFGGWAATLVDSLDTLWIMGMQAEFNEAVAAAADIDFTRTDMEIVNVFETNIRYLGGFLSAFDLSGDVRLLRKAVEVGQMLYKAFDTPNRMPVTRWDVHAAMRGEKQVAGGSPVVAELGSFTMEFTRLSQLTGNPKWFDAAMRIMDAMAAQQNATRIPGLWPQTADAGKMVFNDGALFTLGANADSAYEYLAKMSALTSGQLGMFQTMYEQAIDAAVAHNLFRPMTPRNEDILISGMAHTKKEEGKLIVELIPQGQHLVCFLGGLVALGSKLFSRGDDMTIASKLVDGCVRTYKVFPHGIMPETTMMEPCPSKDSCEWDEIAWKNGVVSEWKKTAADDGKSTTADEIISKGRLPHGFTAIPDRAYLLRPEAIESVFVLYRTTGRKDLIESAWDMFQAVNKSTSTEFANSAVFDVTIADEEPQASDVMESFWMGETLKYYYLAFSEPGVISLDEFVFNTEAHPFRRLVG
ncbi:glycoside hydrolase [Xylariaceae sp. FL1651]|nr:glycoside hydrolase [Xylariaceae sp. FL1651]